jgi:hypothetical protein
MPVPQPNQRRQAWFPRSSDWNVETGLVLYPNPLHGDHGRQIAESSHHYEENMQSSCQSKKCKEVSCGKKPGRYAHQQSGSYLTFWRRPICPGP